MILLEAHQGLWSQLIPETDTNGTEEPRHLTLAGFLQQVNCLYTQADNAYCPNEAMKASL